MKLTIPRLILLVFCFSALAASASSQTDKKDKHSVVVTTNVLVLNDKNEPVRGLTAKDLKLLENDVEQQITSVTELDDGLDLILLVDNTGSVRTQLEDIISIGKNLVANLGSNDQATIIRFVGRDKITTEQEWTNDKRKLSLALDNLFVEGGLSAVIDGLYLASKSLKERLGPSNGRRFAIVLLSDAEDRDSYYGEAALFKLLAGSPIQIFTVTLTRNLPKVLDLSDLGRATRTQDMVINFSNRLAARTGGTAYIIKTKSTNADLDLALRLLNDELHSQYVVSYVAANVTSKNNLRSLSVSVADGPNGEKRTAKTKYAVALEPK